MKFSIDLNMPMQSGIYSITNGIDDRFYIGSTINFLRRYKDHKYKLINKTHANKYLQNFVNKYGIETLSFNLLFICKNTCLVYNEKLWIDVLKPQFNIKPIVQRPYFEDEIIFDQRKWSNALAEALDPGCTERAKEFLKKYPPVPHLSFAEELSYYAGIPPSCEFPKKEVIEEEIKRVKYKCKLT